MPVLWFALLATLCLGLLFAMNNGLVRAQDDAIEFPENSKEPVATFTAIDPEGVTPIAWDIVEAAGDPDGAGDLAATDNADAASFTIDKDGALKFSSPPDYENPAGTNVTDNTYKVVVVACDAALESDACPTTAQAGYHAVTVKVTNVEEKGKVTWSVDPDGAGDLVVGTVNGGDPIVQFQVGADLAIAATGGVTDGDVSGADKEVTERLQWYRTPSKTAMGTAIKDATGATYRVTTDDIGMYIRVEAFYNVGDAGREESASLTSEYPVLASRTNNKMPVFSSAATKRSVDEGKKGRNVGAPVTATDDITNALNYVLGGDDAAKFKIDAKTGQITTNQDLNREHTGADAAPNFGCGASYQCSVTVTATDSAGAFSTATITITLTDVNEEPTFTVTPGTVSSPKAITSPENRRVLFGTATGEGFSDSEDDVTYTATDPETRNLTYSLVGPDGAKFQLRSSSAGKVLEFRAKPDYEKPTDSGRDNVYEVTVRASDGVKYADRMVKVTVTDVDDAPVISGPSSRNFTENNKAAVATFTAIDPEGVTPIAWDIVETAGDPDGAGDLEATDNADAASFTIDKDGALKFSSPPDYENPAGTNVTDNTYKVVVVACDAALESDACPTTAQAGYHAVTVKVTNVEEKGKVTWTVDPDGAGGLVVGTVNGGDPIVQFQVGATLTATAEDGDITDSSQTFTDDVTDEVVGVTWRWHRGGTVITDDSDEPVAVNAYTVTDRDIGSRIRVTAFYTVVTAGETGNEESASLTSDYPVLQARTTGVNDAPEFSSAATKRSVDEGKKGRNVGAPVTATDDIANALNYVLGGDDAAKFKIDAKTGQITTNQDLNREHTGADAAPNFGCGASYQCSVTVTATDSAGAATTATITITLTDVNEKPTFTVTPGTVSSPKAITSPENRRPLFGTATGEGFSDSEDDVTYRATDPEGLNVNLSLMGPDGARFTLSTAGVLSFRAKPDYETPGDANRDNVYEVTVRASDGTLNEDRMVRVTVTDVDEAPVIMGGAGPRVGGRTSVSYPENGTGAVETYRASGFDGAVSWSLTGVDRGDFSLNNGVLAFLSSPNFESAADANGDNTYEVTVTATRGSDTDSLNVTVTVTDVEEQGCGDALVDRYDANDDCTVQKAEVLTAIDDYLDAGDNAPSKADVLRLIDLYLDS